MVENKSNTYSEIIKKVILDCYASQLYGISKIQYYEIGFQNKILYVGCRTGIKNFMALKVYELDFLKLAKTQSKTLMSFKNKDKYRCVECNSDHKLGKLYKYKCCGHRVHAKCAIQALNNGNRCGQCKKNIIEERVLTCTNQKKDICSICLDDTNTTLYNCGHYFHEKCLQELLQHHDKCPMCRDKLSSLSKEAQTFSNIPFSLGDGKDGFSNIQFIKFY